MKRKIKICTIIGAIFFIFLIVYKYIIKDANRKESDNRIISSSDDQKTIILGRKYTKLS